MLFTLVTVLLTAEPSLAVVVSRRVDVKSDVVAKVTSAVEDALAAEHIGNVMGAAEARKRIAEQGLDATSTCENDRVCLLGLLTVLKVDVLIAVDLGRVVDQYAVRVSAIDAEHPSALTERGALVKVKQLQSALPDETQAFARALKPLLEARPSKLEPLQPPPLVITTPAPPPAASPSQRSRFPAIAAFGAGGISLVVSLATVVTGVAEKRRLDTSYNLAGVSSLSRSQAEGAAASANALLTTSLVALLLGFTALGIGAALWIFG